MFFSFHYVMSWTLILPLLSLFLFLSQCFLSTVGEGIYLFNFVSSHNSRRFLIGDICTLFDVRVRASAVNCRETWIPLRAAPQSRKWQVTRQSVNGEELNTHLHSRWTGAQGLCTFVHEEHSECLPKYTPEFVMMYNFWSLSNGIVVTSCWRSGHFCLPRCPVWDEHQICTLSVRECYMCALKWSVCVFTTCTEFLGWAMDTPQLQYVQEVWWRRGFWR